MAKGRLKDSQLYDPKVLDRLKKEFMALQKQVKATTFLLQKFKEENAKIAAETPYGDSQKDIEKIIKAIKDLNDEQLAQAKLTLQQTKLEKQLANARGDNAVATESLKLQIREARKETKAIAEEAINGTNAYKNLTKRTNEAQNELKRLAAEALAVEKQFGKTSKAFKEADKRAKEAGKTFDELEGELRKINEAAKDGRRDVGRYAIAVENLKSTAKRGGDMMKLLGLGLVLKAIEGLTEAFKGSDTGAAAMEKTMGRLTITFQVFVNRIVKAWPIAKDIVVGFFQDIKASVASTANVFINGFNKIISGINNVNEVLGRETIPLMDTYEVKVSETTATLDDLSGAFAGVTDEINEKSKALDKMVDATIAARRADASSVKEIANQSKLLEEQQGIIDSNATSLWKRLDAVKEAEKIETKIFDEQIAMAERQAEIARLRFEQSTDSSEAFLEMATAEAAVMELQAQKQAALNAQFNERLQLIQDIGEIKLDYFIDEIENRIAANQRLIDSEDVSLARRAQLLEDNRRLSEKAFKLQTQAINDIQAESGRAALDFAKLMKMSTEEQLAYLETQEVSEIIMTRTLEVIKERRTVQADLAQSTLDLMQADREYNEVLEDITAQEEALNKARMEGADVDKVLEELEEQRLQNRLDAINEELAAVEEGSAREAELLQERNDILLDIEADKYAKEKELAEKRKKELEDLEKERLEKNKEILEFLDQMQQRFFEKRISRIDKELSEVESSQNRLNELAQAGNEIAERNLALSEKRQAELQRQRQQEEAAQKRAELALAALKTYTAKVEQGSQNPLGDTVTEIGLLQAFISALPGFKEGTEMVGKDGKGKMNMFAEDDYLARLHHGEAVFTAEDNALRPKGMSNHDVMIAAQMVDRMKLDKAAIVQGAQEKMAMARIESPKSTDNALILRTLQEIRDKPQYLGSDFDAYQEAMARKTASRNKIVNEIKSNKGFRIRNITLQ